MTLESFQLGLIETLWIDGLLLGPFSRFSLFMLQKLTLTHVFKIGAKRTRRHILEELQLMLNILAFFVASTYDNKNISKMHHIPVSYIIHSYLKVKSLQFTIDR